MNDRVTASIPETLAERVARLVYSAMQYGAGHAKSAGDRPPDWVARGNSDAQESARRISHSILDLIELETLAGHNELLEDLETLSEDPNEGEHGRRIAQQAGEVIRGMVILRGGGAAQEATVFAVYTNTDLTEGRGQEYVKYYCELRTTAERLGRNGYVQGGSCPISEVKMLKIGGAYYLPLSQASVQRPSGQDLEIQRKRDAESARERRAREILARLAPSLVDDESAFLHEYMGLK